MLAPADVLAVFQALGEDCEFAAFQERATQRKPRTLLANGGCKLDALPGVLADRFAGVGDPAGTRLEWRADWREYRLCATPSLGMHSGHFVPFADAAAQAQATADAAAMLRLLRRQLLADLADPRRIFVFTATGLDAAAVERLHAAFQAASPAGLLCVSPGLAPPGTVARVRPGCYLGGIGGFGYFPPNRPWVGPYETWRALCAAALALHREG